MKSFKSIVKENLPKPLLDIFVRMFSLTAIPADPNAVISDLFPYRIDNEWDTYFELLNVPALLDPNNCKGRNDVSFIFFNVKGEKVFEFEVVNEGMFRNTISIKEVLSKAGIEGNGTFACFHTGSPNWVTANSAFLAERGYTGYQNRNISMTRSYVHGNLDSIARDNKGNLSMLGTTHWKKRQYHLQYELSGPARYEMAFVNTSKSFQKLKVDWISIDKGLIIETETLSIPSKGIIWLQRTVESGSSNRIVINSHLNLARPVIFRSTDNNFDVFHG